jgi:hypothetical protein
VTAALVAWLLGSGVDAGLAMLCGAGGIFTKLRQLVCKGLPQGRVTSVNGGIGAVGAPNGSLSVVVNYNNGQISGFATGGVNIGWNGVAQASLSTGFIQGNLGANNSGFSGKSVTGWGSAAVVGVFGTFGQNVQVGGISAGLNLLGTPTGGVNTTYTSKPLPMGDALIVHAASDPISTFDTIMTITRITLCH